MKKFLAVSFLFIFVVSFSKAVKANTGFCSDINSGNLVYPEDTYLSGQKIPIGFDEYGYNYNAHKFNGYLVNAYLNNVGYPPYKGDDQEYFDRLEAEGLSKDYATGLVFWKYRQDKLDQKWNDAWLSNKDCSGDGLLDQHYGFPTYQGTGGWFTQHWNKTSENDKYIEFYKYVGAPADAILAYGGIAWVDQNYNIIGYNIGNGIALIQEVANDNIDHIVHGNIALSFVSLGLGYYK